jgi:hypothetical protein
VGLIQALPLCAAVRGAELGRLGREMGAQILPVQIASEGDAAVAGLIQDSRGKKTMDAFGVLQLWTVERRLERRDDFRQLRNGDLTSASGGRRMARRRARHWRPGKESPSRPA